MTTTITEEMPVVERDCYNCDSRLTPEDLIENWDVCRKCYRDPATNNCESCRMHLSGIAYPYVCGDCLRQKDKQ